MHYKSIMALAAEEFARNPDMRARVIHPSFNVTTLPEWIAYRHNAPSPAEITERGDVMIAGRYLTPDEIDGLLAELGL